MSNQQATGGVKFLLFLIFIIGFGLNLFVILDAELWHFRIKPNKTKLVNKEKLKKAKESILFVISQNCQTNGCSGTGFVFEPGYIATNRHVVTCQGGQACGTLILRDFRGKDHQARLESIKPGTSNAEDLAILSISDTSLAPLPLADSAEYEVGHEMDQIVTIGYPLVGSGASASDKASFSAVGTISTFDNEGGLFISKGMDVESGNSGGPVILLETGEVLGLTVSVMRGGQVAGVERVIPINRLKNFFEQSMGR